MDDTQQSIVFDVCNNLDVHHKIDSLAGTGKTTTLIGIIEHLVSKGIPPSEIMTTTFTRNAASEIKERLLKQGIHGDLVGTFHSLSLMITKTSISIEQGVQQAPLCLLNYLKTDEGEAFNKKVKVLLVDEFQDVNHIQFDIVTIMARYSTIIGIGDPNQQIYSFRGSKESHFRDFIEPHKVHRLQNNYRSPQSVLDVANSCIPLPLTSKMKNRPKPIVKYFQGLPHEIGCVAQQIQRDVQNGFGPESICVLSRNNNPLNKLEERLTLMNIPVTRRMKPKKVSLSTIHGSKGLEWDIVFVIGCNDNYFPSTKSDQGVMEDQRLFYVACTRAKRRLVFTYSGGNKYLTRYLLKPDHRCLAYNDLPLDTPSFFAQGERDIESIIRDMSSSRQFIETLPEDQETFSVYENFPYVYEQVIPKIDVPSFVEEEELHDVFQQFLCMSAYYAVSPSSVAKETRQVQDFYQKNQSFPDKERKCKLFDDVDDIPDNCMIPLAILPKYEQMLHSAQNGVVTVNVLWMLAMIRWALQSGNRTPMFKHKVDYEALQVIFDDIQGLMGQIASKSPTQYISGKHKEHLFFEHALVQGATVVFVHEMDVVSHVDVLMYLCNVWILGDPSITSMIVLHVVSGIQYTFEVSMETLCYNMERLLS